MVGERRAPPRGRAAGTDSHDRPSSLLGRLGGLWHGDPVARILPAGVRRTLVAFATFAGLLLSMAQSCDPNCGPSSGSTRTTAAAPRATVTPDQGSGARYFQDRARGGDGSGGAPTTTTRTRTATCTPATRTTTRTTRTTQDDGGGNGRRGTGGSAFDQGYDKGYEEGYDDGYSDARRKGSGKGEHDGNGKGRSGNNGSAFDNGYDQGYDDGYDDGYAAGRRRGSGERDDG